MIVLQGKKDRVEQLAFSPDGRSLAVPCSRGVQLWTPAAGAGPTLLPCEHCWDARFTPDGRGLILECSQATVHDLATGSRRAVETLSYPLVELTPDGGSLLVAHRGEYAGTISCHPLADLAATAWEVDTIRYPCTRPMFLPGGDRFVTVETWGDPSVRRIVHAYVTRAARGGAVLHEARADERAHVCKFAQSPDRRLRAEARGRFIHVFRAEDVSAPPVVIANDGRKQFTGVAFHPCGEFLAATSYDNTVKLYDTHDWRRAAAFDWDVGRLRGVAFSPDGMLAAAGGDRGQVVVWDVDV
jgi:WD40 repeat protein